MFKKSYSFLLTGTLLSILVLSGCQSRQDIGRITGAAIGGLVGSQLGSGHGRLVAVSLGTLLGAELGEAIAADLDKNQRHQVVKQVNHSLEYNKDGQTGRWKDPNESVTATTTPLTTYQRASGEYCREFQQEIEIGGQTERGYGTACRQPDGSWKIIA